jgi:hypothetical protein
MSVLSLQERALEKLFGDEREKVQPFSCSLKIDPDDSERSQSSN